MEKATADYLRRLTLNLPESLLIEVDEALLDLRRQGLRSSFSGVVEVALRELLRSSSFSAAIKRHGASVRRSAQAGSRDGKRAGKP